MTSSSAQTLTALVASLRDAARREGGFGRGPLLAEIETAEAALLSAIASLAQDAERYRALRDEALYAFIVKQLGKEADANADALVALNANANTQEKK